MVKTVTRTPGPLYGTGFKPKAKPPGKSAAAFLGLRGQSGMTIGIGAKPMPLPRRPGGPVTPGRPAPGPRPPSRGKPVAKRGVQPSK